MTTERSYQIRLEVFEGPLDLLLHLIEVDKINIYDIPIAAIVTQYLEYLEVMEKINFAQLGDFLVMLATLLEIKSKLLLPKSENDRRTDDLEEGEDPREELARMLLEYQKYKASISELREREKTFTEMFGHRRHFKENLSNFWDILDSSDEDLISSSAQENNGLAKELDWDANEGSLEEVSLYDLLKAFHSIMRRAEDGHFPEILDDEIPIADRIEYILDQLEKEGKLEFSALLQFLTSILDLLSMFLALLELIRLNRVSVKQSKLFGKIYVFKNDRPNLNSGP